MVLLISYGTLITIYIIIHNSYQGLQKNSHRDHNFMLNYYFKNCENLKSSFKRYSKMLIWVNISWLMNIDIFILYPFSISFLLHRQITEYSEPGLETLVSIFPLHTKVSRVILTLTFSRKLNQRKVSDKFSNLGNRFEKSAESLSLSQSLSLISWFSFGKETFPNITSLLVSLATPIYTLFLWA